MTRPFRLFAAICSALLFLSVLAGCSREVQPSVEITYSPSDILPLNELLAAESNNEITDTAQIEALFEALGGKVQLFWPLDISRVDRVQILHLTEDTSNQQYIVKGAYGAKLTQFDSDTQAPFSLAAGSMKNIRAFAIKDNTLNFSGTGDKIPEKDIVTDGYRCPNQHHVYAVTYTIFVENSEKANYQPVGNLVVLFEEQNATANNAA